MLGVAHRVGGRLLVGEFVDRLGRRAVGQARQRARHHERDEPALLGVAEAAPFGVVEALEGHLQVADLGQLGPALEAEHLAAHARDERREGRRRDLRHEAQRLHVLGVVRPLVVADKRAVRLAARLAELVLVDRLEQRALVELGGALEIAAEVALGRVHHPDLELLVGHLAAGHLLEGVHPARELAVEVSSRNDLSVH